MPKLQTAKMGRARRNQKRTIDKRPAFLDAFRACGSLTEAAKAIGVDRGQHYDWLKADPGYQKKFEAARIEVSELLRAEAASEAEKLKESRSPHAKHRPAGKPKPAVSPPRMTASRAKALQAISDGASVPLLKQIAQLIKDAAAGRRPRTNTPARARTPEPALPVEGVQGDEVLDQLARQGIFGKKYKDFGSAPAQAQKTIRFIASAQGA